MKRIEITDDDNFNAKDAVILVVIIIIAMLFAAAVHAQNDDHTPILEATKKTSQVVTTDRAWV